MTKLVPGLFSRPGRLTEQDLSKLREMCQVDIEEEEGSAHGPRRPTEAEKAASAASAVERLTKVTALGKKKQRPLSPKHKDVDKSHQGELARAIQAKVRSNVAAAQASAAKDAGPTSPRGEKDLHAAGADAVEPASACFLMQGKDSAWACRFTAKHDLGVMNRRKELRPDPGWYQMQYDSVKDRIPAFDFSEKPRTERRDLGETASSFGGHATAQSLATVAASGKVPQDLGATAGSFMTGVDLETSASSKPPSPKMLKRSTSTPASTMKERPQLEQMGLGTERPLLQKVGRAPITMNEPKAPPPIQSLQQDLNGYHKQRAPQWDFAKTGSRPPLMRGDDRAPPGRYDYNLDVVARRTVTGMNFERQQGRDYCVRNLGYSAPVRALHPEEDRTQKSSATLRSFQPDRSTSKDALRSRPVHVNDMAKETDRPPLTVKAREYYDKDDPEASAKVLKNQLTFDCDKADVAVTKRRDFKVMEQNRYIPRGKAAVQGNRALSSDIAVRGSVGIGFVETTGQREASLEKLEGRSQQHRRPDAGPKFASYSKFKSLNMKTNWIHGYPHVHSGVGFGGAKQSPLQKSEGLTSFERNDPFLSHFLPCLLYSGGAVFALLG
eukprot:TRINITY_DN15951_c0_g1_i2.p1 TRINITY_DN15951_c0_g1~~TRINITY_DN15951_c0_g1_i2.p1  ORF type:complete len:610 (+),score=140.36 TRINITY_DN15951_c0_g1_i2:188-2017(+)